MTIILVACTTVVLVFVSTSYNSRSTLAESGSLWINNPAPEFKVLEDPVAPVSYSDNDKRCRVEMISVLTNTGIRNEAGCTISTEIGVFTASYFKPKNTSYFLPFDFPGSNRWVSIKKDRVLLRLGDGSLRISESLVKLLSAGQGTGVYPRQYGSNVGSIYAVWTLQNQSGVNVLVDDIVTSPNGDWAVAELANGGYIVIDIMNRTFFRFANYNSFESRSLAITNDGRYVAISRSGLLDIHDLSSCIPPSVGSLNLAAGCLKTSLWDFINQEAQTYEEGVYNSVSRIDFNNDGSKLSAKLSRPGNDLLILLNTTSSIAKQYLSLGDSFSSGEGDIDEHYLPGTNGDRLPEYGIDTSKEKCHISDRSYPYLLADNMSLFGDTFKSVACSGARMNDVGGGGSYMGQNGQLSTSSDPFAIAVDALNNFKPGRTHQVNFVDKYTPQVTTVGVGGNDVDFGGIITACAMPNTCSYAETGVDRAALGGAIANQYFKLREVFSKAQQASQNKVYAVGYPIFADAESVTATECSLNASGLNAQERRLINEGVKYMNAVIARAALDTGIGYIDIQDALSGHELCSGNFLDEAVNGLVKGGEFYGIIGQESFHPNARGHQLISQKIIADKGNLLTNNYCTDPGATLCPAGGNTPPSVPSYFGAQNNVYYDTAKLTAEGLLGDGVAVTSEYLDPGSLVHLELHSDPVDLGEFTVGEDGKLNAEVQVPDGVEPGYHTLHMYGKSMSGQDIDLYQIVLVPGPEGDTDGDGIADDEDPCPFVDASGIDADGDGTDDACDGYIDPDSVAPEVNGEPAYAANDDGWYNSDIVINWSATDPDPSSGLVGQPEATTASTEGYEVEYSSPEVCDNAGNCSIGKLKLNIDKTKPSLGDPEIANNPKGVNQTTTLSANVNDSLSGVKEAEYFIGEDPGVGNGADMQLADGVASAQIGTDMPHGSYTYGVRVMDEAGNWSNAKTVQLDVDGMAPIVSSSLSSPANGFGWHNQDVTISWSSADPAPASGTPNQPANTLASMEGQSITYNSDQSCDSVGNCATGEASISLDKTKPTNFSLIMSGMLPVPFFNFFLGNSTNISVNVSDNLSGISEAEYYFDNDPGKGSAPNMNLQAAKATVTAPMSGLSIGSHKLYVRTQDKAGNWSNSVSVSFQKLF